MFLMEIRTECLSNSDSGSSFCATLLQRMKLEFAPNPEAAIQRPKYLNLALIVAPFAVPAVLYTVTNNLGIVLQSEMDPATYQVFLN